MNDLTQWNNCVTLDAAVEANALRQAVYEADRNGSFQPATLPHYDGEDFKMGQVGTINMALQEVLKSIDVSPTREQRVALLAEMCGYDQATFKSSKQLMFDTASMLIDRLYGGVTPGVNPVTEKMTAIILYCWSVVSDPSIRDWAGIPDGDASLCGDIDGDFPFDDEPEF